MMRHKEKRCVITHFNFCRTCKTCLNDLPEEVSVVWDKIGEACYQVVIIAVGVALGCMGFFELVNIVH